MTSDAELTGAPRFDVVLRGYDRRQVDEHVDRLQRVLGRLRYDVDFLRAQPPAAERPRPTPRPRPGAGAAPGDPDTVGNFTDRMQSILQAAEEEAAEVRNRAQVETETVRAQLGDLMRQRDAVLAELTRMRGQLEGLLGAPTSTMQARERSASWSPPPRQEPPPPQQPPSFWGPLPSASQQAYQYGSPYGPAYPPPPGPPNGAPVGTGRFGVIGTGTQRAVAGPPPGGRPGEPPVGGGPRPPAPGRPGPAHSAPGAHRLPSGTYPAVPPSSGGQGIGPAGGSVQGGPVQGGPAQGSPAQGGPAGGSVQAGQAQGGQAQGPARRPEPDVTDLFQPAAAGRPDGAAQHGRKPGGSPEQEERTALVELPVEPGGAVGAGEASGAAPENGGPHAAHPNADPSIGVRPSDATVLAHQLPAPPPPDPSTQGDNPRDAVSGTGSADSSRTPSSSRSG